MLEPIAKGPDQLGPSGMTPILTYHSVGAFILRGFTPFVVRPNRFRDQLWALSDAGYVSLSVSELVRRRLAGCPPKRAVILTFDDGFAGFLRNVLPALQVSRMTATLYIGRQGKLAGPSRFSQRSLHSIRSTAR